LEPQSFLSKDPHTLFFLFSFAVKFSIKPRISKFFSARSKALQNNSLLFFGKNCLVVPYCNRMKNIFVSIGPFRGLLANLTANKNSEIMFVVPSRGHTIFVVPKKDTSRFTKHFLN